MALVAMACIADPSRVGALALGCTVATPTLTFGTYAPLSGAPQTANGTVTVNCTVGASVQIALSSGNGTFAQRTLLGPAPAFLTYNLYTDAAFSTVWGDGTLGTQTVLVNVPLLLTPASATIYGMIPGAQNVPVGSYSTTITTTITF